MNQDLSMNANQLVAFLQKPTSEFTKADIISFIQQKDIRMVNFMYPGLLHNIPIRPLPEIPFR